MDITSELVLKTENQTSRHFDCKRGYTTKDWCDLIEKGSHAYLYIICGTNLSKPKLAAWVIVMFVWLSHTFWRTWSTQRLPWATATRQQWQWRKPRPRTTAAALLEETRHNRLVIRTLVWTLSRRKELLTFNEQLHGGFKGAAREGRDPAGVRARVTLVKMADDQGFCLDRHFVLQERVVNFDPQLPIRNEDDGFVLFVLFESPLNLGDLVVPRSREEFAWQGDVLPEVSGHGGRRQDSLGLENCPEAQTSQSPSKAPKWWAILHKATKFFRSQF